MNSPVKNASQQSVWRWAKLKFDPTEPKTTNPQWEAQHSALVVFDNGQDCRIYFNPGVLSRLQAGDTVLCHYRRGKWRMAFEQPPELTQKLEGRAVALGERDDFTVPANDVRPTAPPPQLAPVQPLPTLAMPESADVRELVGIFRELKAALPDAQETTIQAFSSTLFMQRRKDEPEF